MQAIQALCTEAILIENGSIKLHGKTLDIINEYLTLGSDYKLEQNWELNNMPGNEHIKVRSIKIISKNIDSTIIDVSTPIDIIIDFINLVFNQKINLSLVLKNTKGDPIFNDSSPGKTLNKGLHRVIVHIPGNFLNDDVYTIDNYFVKDASTVLYKQREPVFFKVLDIPRENTAWYGKWIGAVRPKFNWEYYEI
jgi:lipopolysaccharide transport system ATP-binding protein